MQVKRSIRLNIATQSNKWWWNVQYYESSWSCSKKCEQWYVRARTLLMNHFTKNFLSHIFILFLLQILWLLSSLTFIVWFFFFIDMLTLSYISLLFFFLIFVCLSFNRSCISYGEMFFKFNSTASNTSTSSIDESKSAFNDSYHG